MENTHIHANPELKDVKLWQVCQDCTPLFRIGILFVVFTAVNLIVLLFVRAGL
jgi:hypothetical protein